MLTVRLPGLVWILALWLSGGASLAWPQAAFAQKKHPEELKGAKSGPSETPATLRFVNRSPQTVSIYWLDFDGQRKFYQQLKSGETYEQSTFVKHPWIVTDDAGNAWSIHYGKADPQTVEI